MRYLTLGEALELHARIMAQSGGEASLARLPGLESAVALLRPTFDGADLHPTVGGQAAIPDLRFFR